MISIARRRIPLLTEDEYEFVDLGLPSGLLWAKCNVGSETETDSGLYFSWGETTGYAATKVFDWEHYKYNNDGSRPANSDMSKYNATDGKIVLDLEDDAVRVNMGGEWRMPTIEEYRELTANTTNTWVTNYNGKSVVGRLFTSKTDQNVKLFFPAETNYYWSSSCYPNSNKLSSRYFYFNRTNVTEGGRDRFYGQNVRGVRSA